MNTHYTQHCEGYPTFIVWEGEAYCPSCANKFAQEEEQDDSLEEEERIFSRPSDSGIGQSINWEDKTLYCSSMHGCGKHISPAYE